MQTAKTTDPWTVIRDAWIANLRSGKFTQGRWVLKNYARPRIGQDPGMPESFCCLGVLCETLEDVTEVSRRELDSSDGTGAYEFPGDAMWYNASIPQTGALAALKDAVLYNGDPRELMSLLMLRNDANDIAEHWDFEEIADFLEKNT